MEVRLEERWKTFVEHEVEQGRFASTDAVVAEGLRLVAEREAKLRALKKSLEDAIAEGGDVSDEELDAAIEARAVELRKMGYAD